MSKVTMSATYVVSNPSGWQWQIAESPENSGFITVAFYDENMAVGDNLTFTKEEAMLIASALQKLAIK